MLNRTSNFDFELHMANHMDEHICIYIHHANLFWIIPEVSGYILQPMCFFILQLFLSKFFRSSCYKHPL